MRFFTGALLALAITALFFVDEIGGRSVVAIWLIFWLFLAFDLAAQRIAEHQDRIRRCNEDWERRREALMKRQMAEARRIGLEVYERRQRGEDV